MTQRVSVPDPRCDECPNRVEQKQIERSARATNGVPVGPWLCTKCEAALAARFTRGMFAHQHNKLVESNSFDTLCNEVDPRLAEAVHKAQFI